MNVHPRFVRIRVLTLLAFALMLTSCSSVVLFKKTRETAALREARKILWSLGNAADIIIRTQDSSEIPKDREAFRRLFVLIETKRSIFDYPKLISYGYVAWQSWDKRYRFRIGIRDAIQEGNTTSEFYIYTDVNGNILEKKPVDYLL